MNQLLDLSELVKQLGLEQLAVKGRDLTHDTLIGLLHSCRSKYV